MYLSIVQYTSWCSSYSLYASPRHTITSISNQHCKLALKQHHNLIILLLKAGNGNAGTGDQIMHAHPSFVCGYCEPYAVLDILQADLVIFFVRIMWLQPIVVNQVYINGGQFVPSWLFVLHILLQLCDSQLVACRLQVGIN